VSHVHEFQGRLCHDVPAPEVYSRKVSINIDRLLAAVKDRF